jgi:hypothetical protein
MAFVGRVDGMEVLKQTNGDKGLIRAGLLSGKWDELAAMSAVELQNRFTQAAAKPPTQTVFERLLGPQQQAQGGLPPPPPSMGGAVMQPPGAPPMPSQMASPPTQAQPRMLAGGGLASLPIPDHMFDDSYAGGGVVAFADGGTAELIAAKKRELERTVGTQRRTQLLQEIEDLERGEVLGATGESRYQNLLDELDQARGQGEPTPGAPQLPEGYRPLSNLGPLPVSPWAGGEAFSPSGLSLEEIQNRGRVKDQYESALAPFSKQNQPQPQAPGPVNLPSFVDPNTLSQLLPQHGPRGDLLAGGIPGGGPNTQGPERPSAEEYAKRGFIQNTRDILGSGPMNAPMGRGSARAEFVDPNNIQLPGRQTNTMTFGPNGEPIRDYDTTGTPAPTRGPVNLPDLAGADISTRGGGVGEGGIAETLANPVTQPPQPEQRDLAGILAEYEGLMPERTEPEYIQKLQDQLASRKKEDLWTALGQLGFGMAAAGSKPGATFLGALGESGAATMGTMQEMIKEQRGTKDQLEAAKYADKEAARGEKRENVTAAYQTYLGLNKEDRDRLDKEQDRAIEEKRAKDLGEYYRTIGRNSGIQASQGTAADRGVERYFRGLKAQNARLSAEEQLSDDELWAKAQATADATSSPYAGRSPYVGRTGEIEGRILMEERLKQDGWEARVRQLRMDLVEAKRAALLSGEDLGGDGSVIAAEEYFSR